MLGYTQPNSDLYVFFEQDEIQRLQSERIQGTYFNLKDTTKTALLEASINNEIDDRIKTSATVDDSGLKSWFHLEFRLREYAQLVETGSLQIHEGFRHICVFDASRIDELNLLNKANYERLASWKSKH